MHDHYQGATLKPETWTEPVTTVAAGSEPITLAEAKAQCRVTSSDHDVSLNQYIAAARDYVERYTGLRLVSQTVTISRRNLIREMPLPVAPVQSVSSISYQDADNATQTLSASLYVFSGASTLRPKLTRADGASWPSLYNTPEAVTATLVVGYSAVPDALKAALLLLIAHWFDHREAVSGTAMSEAPHTVTNLLENYRVFA